MTEVNQEIFKEVVAIIAKHAKNQNALSSVSMETSISDDLQVNSARFVDIILDFEDKYDLEIDDDAADKIEKIGDAVTLIQGMVH